MNGFDWKATIPWLLSLATIAIGIWQYADKQAQANREPFLREQMKFLFEASDVVSTLASTTDAKTWQDARARFWVLYWGPLSLVEDIPVERCMVKAGALVPPPEIAETPELPLKKLQNISYELAHLARNLVIQSWDAQLAMTASNSFKICQNG